MKIPKKTLTIASSIAVLVTASYIWSTMTKEKTPAVTVKEAQAIKGNIDVYIEADGIVSVEKAKVNFTQTGTLKSITVKIGDQVKAGAVLATLESGKLQYQVDQARETYETNLAKANRLKPGTGEEIILKERVFDAAKIALAAEVNIYNDVVSKYGTGSTQELTEYAKLKKAEADVTSAEAQLALTQATYSDAQNSVSSSLASLKAAKLALAEATLKSPIAGVVTSIDGTLGQSTGGTQQSTTGLITISKIDNVSLVSNVDEEDIMKVKIGQKIEAEFSSLGATVTGKIAYVSPVAKIDSNGLATYEVRSNLNLGETKIIDGMGASMKIITKSVERVVKITNKAVKIVDGKSVVSYYGSAKEILTKEIVTGFTDGQYVEVVSGLAEGEKYITTETK